MPEEIILPQNDSDLEILEVLNSNIVIRAIDTASDTIFDEMAFYDLTPLVSFLGIYKQFLSEKDFLQSKGKDIRDLESGHHVIETFNTYLKAHTNTDILAEFAEIRNLKLPEGWAEIDAPLRAAAIAATKKIQKTSQFLNSANFRGNEKEILEHQKRIAGLTKNLKENKSADVRAVNEFRSVVIKEMYNVGLDKKTRMVVRQLLNKIPHDKSEDDIADLLRKKTDNDTFEKNANYANAREIMQNKIKTYNKTNEGYVSEINELVEDLILAYQDPENNGEITKNNAILIESMISQFIKTINYRPELRVQILRFDVLADFLNNVLPPLVNEQKFLIANKKLQTLSATATNPNSSLSIAVNKSLEAAREPYEKMSEKELTKVLPLLTDWVEKTAHTIKDPNEDNINQYKRVSQKIKTIDRSWSTRIYDAAMLVIDVIQKSFLLESARVAAAKLIESGSVSAAFSSGQQHFMDGITSTKNNIVRFFTRPNSPYGNALNKASKDVITKVKIAEVKVAEVKKAKVK